MTRTTATPTDHNRFDTLFEHAPFSMQLLDPQGRTLRVNKAWLALWQLEGDADFLRWILTDYNILSDPQLEAKGILPLLRRAFAGETVSLPAICYDPAEMGRHGRKRWLRARAHPVRAEDGSVAEVMLIHEDVSEEMRAQEAAKLSEMRLKQLVSAIPQLAWMADPDGDVHWYNERWYAYTGTTLQQLRQEGWRIVHDPRVLPEVVARWEHSIATGEPFEMTVPIRGQDGRFRPFYTLVAPLKDDDGRVLQWFGTNTDVTALHEAQASLRIAEERLRLATEAGSVGIWEVDLATGEGTWSREAMAILGTSRSAYSMADWAEIVDARDRQAAAQAWIEAIERGVPYDTEFRTHTKGADGQDRWVLSRGKVERDAQGRPLRGLGVALDITELRRSQNALIESERRLRAADERKNEFLAMLAHELRNPLAPIRNALHILRSNGGEARRREQMLSLMERQTAHMVRLVDDLLEVSRITQGKIHLGKELVDLCQVVREAAETASSWREAGPLELALDLPEAPVLLQADPVRLAQIMGNLLHNACKYTPPQGHVRVQLGRDGAWAQLRVVDDGAGIPADMLERVFELFTQVPRPQARAQGGLGIGLALVRTLVELHGGRVWADSAGIGQGTTVTLRLPLALPGQDEPGAAAAEATPDAALCRRILVVDDNQDAADTLAMMLRLEGSEVRIAYDGEQALALAEAFLPQVVLLDIGLPGISGHETAQRMRRQPWGRQAVLVALTGWGQAEDRRLAIRSGFDAHMAKPADPAQLLALLSSLLEGRGL
ncbi:hybrid sensor histidine kinase/response regulator [Azohydromonas caseinilytica]|uniref:histidine kinase n=1 Tax=Azohydromonas caseinilytica TaxID=2728836 RepID=A0A848FC54_9BURK|nr:PAS domain S-box protein [Azohydromonas caseinilytica]NML16516.1 PAS domain S-box protein [Azohydromonas caseinilytica]